MLCWKRNKWALEQGLRTGGRFSWFLWLCSWALLRPGQRGTPPSKYVSLADKTRECRGATSLIPSLLPVTRTEAFWYHAGVERRGGSPGPAPALDLLRCPFFPSNPRPPPPIPAPDPAGELPCITVAPTARIRPSGCSSQGPSRSGPEDWERGSAGLNTPAEGQKTLPLSACFFAFRLHIEMFGRR